MKDFDNIVPFYLLISSTHLLPHTNLEKTANPLGAKENKCGEHYCTIFVLNYTKFYYHKSKKI